MSFQKYLRLFIPVIILFCIDISVRYSSGQSIYYVYLVCVCVCAVEMTAFSKQRVHTALSLSSRLRLMLIQCYSSFSDLWPMGEGEKEWLMIFFAILISSGGAIGASVIK